VVVEFYPSLSNYIGLIPYIESRIKAGMERSSAREERNREPLTVAEIREMAESCESFDELSLLLLYLSMGFRAGEAERASVKNLAATGVFEFEGVTTKEKVRQLPQAPFVARVILLIGDSAKELRPEVDRRRFRATCAVYLNLSGWPTQRIYLRLNHANMTMCNTRYAKTAPKDIGARAVEDYLDVATTFSVVDDGAASEDERVKVIRENFWDLFVLEMLFEHSARFGKLTEVKRVLLSIFRPEKKREKNLCY
jgi:integrase